MSQIEGIFNGDERVFYCAVGVNLLTVEDLYEDWKQWVVSGLGSQYLPMFSAIGKVPSSTGFTGQYFTIINGWKIKPYDGNHRLQIIGNLDSETGEDYIIPSPGFTVHVQSVRSDLAQGIAVPNSDLGDLSTSLQKLLLINSLISGVEVVGKDPLVNNPGFRKVIDSNNQETILEQEYTVNSDVEFKLRLIDETAD